MLDDQFNHDTTCCSLSHSSKHLLSISLSLSHQSVSLLLSCWPLQLYTLFNSGTLGVSVGSPSGLVYTADTTGRASFISQDSCRLHMTSHSRSRPRVLKLKHTLIFQQQIKSHLQSCSSVVFHVWRKSRVYFNLGLIFIVLSIISTNKYNPAWINLHLQVHSSNNICHWKAYKC